jgi:hypothetical protein
LTPFVDYLANVSSESQFLIELERLIGESAPELISGNVDVYLTAVIDHYERRPDPDLLSKYSKCRERFRKYRSARPELQLLNPTHTEGESNRNMRDEVLSFTNVEDIVDYANDFPLILTEESLAEWKPHAELFRHSDQWHHLTLLHGERLGVLQLLS